VAVFWGEVREGGSGGGGVRAYIEKPALFLDMQHTAAAVSKRTHCWSSTDIL
jgi:hypothetical protein